MNYSYLIGTIDRAIKEIWLYNIKQDYKTCHLLKEDTLKNSIYYHLRTKLSAAFLEANRIRIFTEYHYCGFRADLAIVRLRQDYEETSCYLGDNVEQVLAIIEVKYKGHSGTEPFEQDITKVKTYIDSVNDEHFTQYYLAFIHEYEYYHDVVASWMTDDQKKWARGNVTELCAYYREGQEEMQWDIVAHNHLNAELTTAPEEIMD
ncbi:hypothetical protein [Ectobacillus funiculus]|uniref:hypothetical protein n=1 Tax=Ectobacillus funiculus TaxID=137993 RepID=UPI00101DE9CB|nr:hypothetical protein [Ectobacillus funiculus]